MNNKHGQALIEYILIVVIICIVVVSLVSFLGGYVKDIMTKSTCNFIGDEYVEGNKPGEGTCIKATVEIED